MKLQEVGCSLVDLICANDGAIEYIVFNFHTANEIKEEMVVEMREKVKEK